MRMREDTVISVMFTHCSVDQNHFCVFAEPYTLTDRYW